MHITRKPHVILTITQPMMELITLQENVLITMKFSIVMTGAVTMMSIGVNMNAFLMPLRLKVVKSDTSLTITSTQKPAVVKKNAVKPMRSILKASIVAAKRTLLSIRPVMIMIKMLVAATETILVALIMPLVCARALTTISVVLMMKLFAMVNVIQRATHAVTQDT